MQMEKDYKRLLEEFNQEIETLVAERTMSLMALTVADKIRNPAAIIGLTCKRILEREEVSERLEPKLQGIMEEAEKLDNIVNDFQSLLESRKSMFSHEDINDIVASVISINESKADDKGVELVFSPAENPVRLNIQKNLFQIAISHLIRNAIEATPDGGSIKVLIYEGGSHVMLTISDTGYGISREVVERIFDPMFSTKKRRFGMGLPLVKRIVSEHMGEIDIESTPGEGSVFRIKLPLRWIEQ